MPGGGHALTGVLFLSRKAQNDEMLARLPRRLMIALLALTAFTSALAAAQPPGAIVLGTARPEGNYVGDFLNRIFVEAFRRLDLPLEIRLVPTARLSAMVAGGELDGELVRARAYGDSQPNLVRVEAPVVDVHFALWAATPDISLTRLDELATRELSVNYVRGVLGCEQALGPVVPPKLLTAVNASEPALEMLRLGRVQIHCGIDFTVLALAGSAEFKGRLKLHKVLSVGEPTAFYPYLHRRNATLAPRLAAVLTEMKNDGSIARLQALTKKEFGLE